MSIPSDMAAVYDNSKNEWWIYWISSEGQIKFAQGPNNNQSENEDVKYSMSIPNVGEGKDIPAPKAGNPQLGVCEYVDKAGNPQTRLYYLDKADRLVEMGWNNDKGWFKGSLTNQGFKGVANSVITAAVTQDQLKVYYRGDDHDDGRPRLWVTWVTKGETTWSRRDVLTF